MNNQLEAKELLSQDLEQQHQEVLVAKTREWEAERKQKDDGIKEKDTIIAMLTEGIIIIPKPIQNLV